MTDPKITLTAVDQTAPAFAAVSQRFNELKAGAASISSSFSVVTASLASIGISVGAIAANIKGAIDAADELNKLSQKVGISVENLSGLKFAAELSNVSLEQLQLGLRGLSDTMSKANDATSKEAALLKTLGVNAKDPHEAFKQLADVFEVLPASFDKVTLAGELFGAKVGQQLIPLLNGGRKALDETSESARKLGLIISTQTARAAEEFNDNVSKLTRGAQAFGISITGRIIGGLAEFTTGMVKAKEEGELLRKVLADISGVGLELASRLPGNIGQFFNRLQDLNTAAEAARAKAKETSAGILSGAQEFSRRFSNQQVGPPVPADIEERVRKWFAERNKPAASGPKGMTLDELLAQGSLLRERRQDQANEEADAKAKAALDAESAMALRRQQFEEEQNRAADERLTKLREEAQAYIDLIDPVAKYRRQLEDIERLMGEGFLTSDQADAAREKVYDDIRKLSDLTKGTTDIARDLGLTFSSAFEDAIIGGKKFSEVLKGIGQDIAKIIIRKSITEPLANDISNLFKGDSSSGGGNILGSLFEAGKKLFGFASGGSFTVGGAGGTDSQLVAFKATPGERVTVQTPSQQGGSPQFTFNFTVGVGAEVRSEIMAMLPMIQRAALAGTIDAKRRGVAV